METQDSSTPDDFRKTLGILRGVVSLATLPAAIEPVCGWRWAVKLLEEEGVAVKVANPRKVRIIADSLDKTDDNDAARLAWIRLVDKLPTSYVAPDNIVDLRRLVRGYMSLVRVRTKMKNRIQALATDEGLHITLGNASTAKGLALLQEVRKDDPTYKAFITALADIEAAFRPLHAKMVALTSLHPVIRRLATMPSVGLVTATTICAEVGDFYRFRSGKQIASFAGLVPRERSSGGTVRQGHITKTGSNVLRHLIVEDWGAPDSRYFITHTVGHEGEKKEGEENQKSGAGISNFSPVSPTKTVLVIIACSLKGSCGKKREKENCGDNEHMSFCRHGFYICDFFFPHFKSVRFLRMSTIDAKA